MTRLIRRTNGQPDGLTSFGWVVWFAAIVALIAFVVLVSQ